MVSRVAPGTSAFAARAWKKHWKFRGSIGVPYRVVRTSPDPIQASPAANRERASVTLRWARARAQMSGSGSGASDDTVFVGRRRSSPLILCSCQQSGPSVGHPRATDSMSSPALRQFRVPVRRSRGWATTAEPPAATPLRPEWLFEGRNPSPNSAGRATSTA